MTHKDQILLIRILNLLNGSFYHFTDLYIFFSKPYESLDKELDSIGLSARCYNEKSSGRYGLYSRTKFLAYIEREFPRHYMIIVEQEVKDL